MKNDLAKVLITQEEIQRRVTEMGAEIARVLSLIHISVRGQKALLHKELLSFTRFRS